MEVAWHRNEAGGRPVVGGPEVRGGMGGVGVGAGGVAATPAVDEGDWGGWVVRGVSGHCAWWKMCDLLGDGCGCAKGSCGSGSGLVIDVIGELKLVLEGGW